MVGFEWSSLIQDCEDLRIVRVYMCVLWLIDMCKGVKVTVNQGLQNRIKTLKVCECRDANRKTRQSSAEICKSVSFLMALAWKNTTDFVNIYILNQPNENLLNNIARSVIHISRASMFPRLSRAPYSKSVTRPNQRAIIHRAMYGISRKEIIRYPLRTPFRPGTELRKTPQSVQ